MPVLGDVVGCLRKQRPAFVVDVTREILEKIGGWPTADGGDVGTSGISMPTAIWTLFSASVITKTGQTEST